MKLTYKHDLQVIKKWNSVLLIQLVKLSFLKVDILCLSLGSYGEEIKQPALIGKIWNRRRNWANRILLDSRRTLWARDKIRIRRTRTSIGYSKRIRNPEDQSQHYRGMFFVIIKTRSLSIDNVIRGNRIRSALLDWQTWILHMFDKEAWERFIGLMNMEVATGEVEKRAGASKQLFSAAVGGNTKKRFVHPFISPCKHTTAKRWVLFVFAVSIVLISSLSTLGFIFIFSLFLVVQFKWATFPRKGWGTGEKSGIMWLIWFSSTLGIDFIGLFSLGHTLGLVSLNQVQRIYGARKVIRFVSLVMLYDERVCVRAMVFHYLSLSRVPLSEERSMYAMLVIFLDRGNSLRDGVQVRANHKFGFRDSTYNGLISISNVRIMMIGKRNNGFQWCNGVPHGIDRTSHKTDFENGVELEMPL
ncbi:hypothetical protein YC2023_005217 [Brassica napus]